MGQRGDRQVFDTKIRRRTAGEKVMRGILPLLVKVAPTQYSMHPRETE